MKDSFTIVVFLFVFDDRIDKRIKENDLFDEYDIVQQLFPQSTPKGDVLICIYLNE